MKEAIRRIILRLFPELKAGLHLPIFAVVSSITDPPDKEAISDFYRPYYAVNVQLLDENLQEDHKQPLLEAVPVAQMAAGQERGFAALPQPGAIVELAFAYGKQSKPFIRSVLPYRMSLPIIDADAQKWQQNHDCYQQVDCAGNWTRQTNGTITDDCSSYVGQHTEKLQNIVNELKNVTGHSTKKVSGVKKLIAGAIKFLTAGTVSIGGGDNVNITAGQHVNLASGLKTFIKSGADFKVEANKIYIGNESINSLDKIVNYMQHVIDALIILDNHSHPSVGKMSQRITPQRTSAQSEKDQLDSIKL